MHVLGNNHATAVDQRLLPSTISKEVSYLISDKWEEIQEVETLWTVGASNTHISPKWVTTTMQSHSNISSNQYKVKIWIYCLSM